MFFSVIVPMYNVQLYAKECIESVLGQSWPDFELIIVDDGSTDETAKIIDSYAAMDSRVKAIHKENGGVTSARKSGIQEARGQYVVIVDGDDWLEPEALECVAQALEHQKTDMVFFGHFRALDPEKKEKTVAVTQKIRVLDRQMIKAELMPNLFPADRTYQCLPYIWGKAFKRELYMHYLFAVDDRITMGEDGAVTYPLICAAQSICLLPQILYNYRMNPNSLTRSKKKYLSWDSALLRIEHYQRYLPGTGDMEKQIARFTVHSLFNVIRSHFNHEPYKQVKTEAESILRRLEIARYITNASFKNNPKESLAKIALQYRLFWLIKLYSMIS